MPTSKPGSQLNVRKYVGPAVAGSVALFSLLATNQLVWSAFNSLGASLSGPFIWIKNDPKIHPGPRKQLISDNKLVRFQLTAPPGSSVLVSQDFVPAGSIFVPSRLGKADRWVHLHRGMNQLSFTVQKEAEYLYGFQQLPAIEYRAKSKLAPSIAATWNAGNAVDVLGFGEPDSTVEICSGGHGGNFSSIDSTGSFVGSVPVVPNETVNMQKLSARFPDANPSGCSANGPAKDVTAAKSLVSRQLKVSIASGSYTISGDFTLPVESSLNEEAEEGGTSALRLLNQVFGICLSLDPPAQGQSNFGGACGNLSAAAKTSMAHDVSGEVTFEIKDSRPPGDVSVRLAQTPALANTFLQLPEDKLTLQVENGRIETQIPPSEQSADTLLWRGPQRRLTDATDLAAVTFVPPNARSPSSAPAASVSENAPSIIQRIRKLESLPPRQVKQAMYFLLAAVPFIWFLTILKRPELKGSAGARLLRASVLTLLVLHLTVLALSFFEAAIGAWALDLAHELIADIQTREKALQMLSNVRSVYPFLAIAIALLVRPIYRAFARREPERSGWQHTAARGLLWIAFWIVVIAAPAAAAWVRFSSLQVTGQPALWGALKLLGGSLLFLWFVLYWLLRRVCRIAITMRDAVWAGTAMAVLPVFPPLADAAVGWVRGGLAANAGIYAWFLPNTAAPYIWIVLVTLLAAALVWQIGRVVFGMMPRSGVRKWWLSRPAWMIFAALLVMGLPASETRYAGVYSLSGFLYSVDNFLVFALLLGALRLAQLLNPKDQWELPPGTLQLGSMVFAVFICGQSTLLFIPIPLILGSLLFRHWLIVPAPRGVESQAAVIRAYVEERRARTMVEDLEKSLRKKVAEGALAPADAGGRLDAAQHDELYAQAKLRIAVSGAKSAPELQSWLEAPEKNGGGEDAPPVFLFGPEASPLKNARTAVIYGSVLSIPFFVTTLSSTLQRPGSDFPLLDLMYALMASWLIWILTASVFGYFYHRIRGRNGFEKALCFAGAGIAATLPLRILAGQQLFRPEPLLGVVELVAFILVLALLAFDLRTLQKQAMGWRELFTVYGFASAAYGSTIALATAVIVWGKDLVPYLSKALGWLSGK